MTQPLTGMSTRNISWELNADGVGLTTLTPGSLNFLETSGPLQAYARITLPFTVLLGLHVEYPLLSYFNETSIFRQIFEKFSNIKFHENPSSGRGVVPCGRTDMTKLIVAFRGFANAPKNDWDAIGRYQTGPRQNVSSLWFTPLFYARSMLHVYILLNEYFVNASQNQSAHVKVSRVKSVIVAYWHY